MGIFSKLNFRAVDAAYKDVAALSFVTFLSIQCKHECQHLDDVVDLQRIAQRVAEENAQSIISVSTGRMEADAALLRLGQVVRGITKELKAEVGARPTVGALFEVLDKFFDLIAAKVLQSAQRGYLNIGLRDADYFVTKLRLTMIDSQAHFMAVSQIIQEAQASATDYGTEDTVKHSSVPLDSRPSIDSGADGSRSSETKRPRSDPSSSDAIRSSGSPRVIREIDRRPNRPGYTGIWDLDSGASRPQTKPSSSRTQRPQPKAHDIRQSRADANQVVEKEFCAPVIIERPSSAIGEEKLVEDVGLTTSNGDFIAILDKFSWLPHARTTRIPLDVSTTEAITVTFARRKSAFDSHFTTLGTFLLSGFSSLNGASTNTLEICLSAIEAGLHFQARDEAGSNLTIKRQ